MRDADEERGEHRQREDNGEDAEGVETPFRGVPPPQAPVGGAGEGAAAAPRRPRSSHS